MNMHEYLARLIEKNPTLRGGAGKLTISIPEFLRHVQRAYEAGQQDEKGKAEAVKSFANVSAKPKMPDFFQDLFKT